MSTLASRYHPKHWLVFPRSDVSLRHAQEPPPESSITAATAVPPAITG